MDHVKTGYKDANCAKLAGYRIQWYAFAVVVVVVGMMIMKLDIIRW